MKSYKEIALEYETSIKELMKEPDEAIKKGVCVLIDIWNSAMCKVENEQEPYTLEERKDLYEEMLGFSETLILPTLQMAKKGQGWQGMYSFHIQTLMKKNLKEIEDLQQKHLAVN